MAVASEVPVRILGVAGMAEVWTMLLRGRRLLASWVVGVGLTRTAVSLQDVVRAGFMLGLR